MFNSLKSAQSDCTSFVSLLQSDNNFKTTKLKFNQMVEKTPVVNNKDATPVNHINHGEEAKGTELK